MRMDYFLERVLLELQVTYDGTHEIPDQIVAPFQLDINLFPAVGGL